MNPAFFTGRANHGSAHGLAPPRDPWRTQNIVNAIDGALDAIIQLFYLRRERFAVGGTRQLPPEADTFDVGLGLAELALVTALDWMDFRSAFPTDGAPGLTRVRAAFRDRPSVASTAPRE